MNAAPTPARQKRRIVPVSLGPPAAASTAAPVAAAPPPEPIPRTLDQLKAEVHKDAQSLVDAAEPWTEAAHAAIVFSDDDDVAAIALAATRFGRSVGVYKERARACEEAALAAEERRKRELKPVGIDAGTPLYRKHKGRLGGQHASLFMCPMAGPDGVCTTEKSKRRHCKPNSKHKIEEHIKSVHLRGGASKRAREGLRAGMSEGWIE